MQSLYVRLFVRSNEIGSVVKLGSNLVKIEFGPNMNIDPSLFCSTNMLKMFPSSKLHNSISYEQKSRQSALKHH
jgi:hypothetical protein